MPVTKPLLSFRVEQPFMDRLEAYWRYRTKHRHLADAARELLEDALKRAEAPDAPAGPPAAADDAR